MSTATADPKTGDAAVQIAEASDRLAERMTTEYTPIWEVSDFLLDAAAALSADPLAVAEVHELLKGLAPSANRTVARTTDVASIVRSVRRIVEAQASTPAELR